jgi:hypothetical protein
MDTLLPGRVPLGVHTSRVGDQDRGWIGRWARRRQRPGDQSVDGRTGPTYLARASSSARRTRILDSSDRYSALALVSLTGLVPSGA